MEIKSRSCHASREQSELVTVTTTISDNNNATFCILSFISFHSSLFVKLFEFGIRTQFLLGYIFCCKKKGGRGLASAVNMLSVCFCVPNSLSLNSRKFFMKIGTKIIPFWAHFAAFTVTHRQFLQYG